MWTDIDMFYDSMSDVVREYDEVFATPGFQKMFLREIEEHRQETAEILEKDE